MDRRFDIGLAIAFIALGIFVIIVASGIPSGIHKDPVGPRAFFYGCAGVFILGGLVTVARRAMSWRYELGNIVQAEGTGDEPEQPVSAVRAATLFTLTILYAVLFEPLGYLIVTPLFIVAGLVILRVRNAVGVGAIAIIFTLLAYLVFAQFLDVRLPVGPLTDFFRSMGWIVL